MKPSPPCHRDTGRPLEGRCPRTSRSARATWGRDTRTRPRDRGSPCVPPGSTARASRCWGGLGTGTFLAYLVLGLRWVPDCGGVAYGLPLPWLQTHMGSSMEFDWSVLALLVDGLS